MSFEKLSFGKLSGWKLTSRKLSSGKLRNSRIGILSGGKFAAHPVTQSNFYTAGQYHLREKEKTFVKKL